MTHEELRLEETRQKRAHWQRWGPYLSERAWGTVREDYSPYGNAWEYLSHDHARSRAYRWNEDGIAGICDRHQHICFARGAVERPRSDPERAALRSDRQRGQSRRGREGMLLLPGQHAHALLHEVPVQVPAGRVSVCAAGGREPPPRQAQPRIRADGHGRFRGQPLLRRRRWNTRRTLQKTSWCGSPSPTTARSARRFTCCPRSGFATRGRGETTASGPCSASASGARPGIELEHSNLGRRRLACEGAPELLFTENETNLQRLYGSPNGSPYVKDGINEYVVNGAPDAVNPEQAGTKAAAQYVLSLAPGETQSVRLRLRPPRAERRIIRRRLRRHLRRPDARSRRVLRDRDSGRSLAGCPQRDAAGALPACCGRSSSITTWSATG